MQTDHPPLNRGIVNSRENLLLSPRRSFRETEQVAPINELCIHGPRPYLGPLNHSARVRRSPFPRMYFIFNRRTDADSRTFSGYVSPPFSAFRLGELLEYYSRGDRKANWQRDIVCVLHNGPGNGAQGNYLPR